MTASLDSQLAVWVEQVFTASLTGALTEDDLKRTLVASGEMSRWDQQRPRADALRKLEDAEKIVPILAQAALPSRSHIQLADLLRQVAETKRILQSEKSEWHKRFTIVQADQGPRAENGSRKHDRQERHSQITVLR